VFQGDVAPAMSLAVAFRGHEGIVLAADSRVTMMVPQPAQIIPGAPAGAPMMVPIYPTYFDNAHKLLSFRGQPFVGIVTFGAGAIGQQEPRTVQGYLPEFEAHLTGVAGIDAATGAQLRLTTLQVAQELETFFNAQWSAGGMPPAPLTPGVQPLTFLVGGYDDGEPYGHIYELSIPNNIVPQEKLPFAPTFGGMNELMARLLNGFDPRALELTKNYLSLDDTQVAALRGIRDQNLSLQIPYQFLPLQDCVDLSVAIISMTIQIQSWMFGIRGVGGEIDVATISREDGLKHVYQKVIKVRD
jgi:hypothetical protein